MTTPDIVELVIDALNACGAQYLVTGSLASNSYGIARSTKDADFVMEAGDKHTAAVVRAVAPAFRLDPQMSFETISMTHKTVLRHHESDFMIELFALSNEPFDQLRFARRRLAQVLGRPLWLPTPEDVVVQKLRWSRDGRRGKDTDDARDVLAVQAGSLDMAYIESWCQEHGTLELLRRLRDEIPR